MQYISIDAWDSVKHYKLERESKHDQHRNQTIQRNRPKRRILEITEQDVKGKWAVFFFYPADFTFLYVQQN